MGNSECWAGPAGCHPNCRRRCGSPVRPTRARTQLATRRYPGRAGPDCHRDRRVSARPVVSTSARAAPRNRQPGTRFGPGDNCTAPPSPGRARRTGSRRPSCTQHDGGWARGRRRVGGGRSAAPPRVRRGRSPPGRPARAQPSPSCPAHKHNAAGPGTGRALAAPPQPGPPGPHEQRRRIRGRERPQRRRGRRGRLRPWARPRSRCRGP